MYFNLQTLGEKIVSKEVTNVYTTVEANSGLVSHLTYLNDYIGTEPVIPEKLTRKQIDTMLKNAGFNRHQRRAWYKTDIDLSFQSRSRWEMTKREEFINSCLVNMNISKFVLVDVKKCLANAVEDEDIEYFKGWLKKGVLFLNVDSNNRTITLRMFRDNEVKIPHGDYPQKSGIVYSVDKTNDTYDTMDKAFRGVFESNAMSIYVVEKSSRKQLGDIFERMNNGVPLNFFEQQNCVYSVTCSTIRGLADDLCEIFEKAGVFSVTDINRRVIDGWLANVSYLALYKGGGYGRAFGKPVHRKWYASTSSSNKVMGQFAESFKEFILEVVGDKLNLMHHKWVVFDLYYAYRQQIVVNGKILSEDNTMVQDFADMYTILMNDKKAKYFYLKEGEKYEEGKTVLFPFKNTIKGEGGHTQVRVDAYKDADWDITKYFEDPIKKDPKRTVTKIEKQGIALRDGWKDSDGDGFVPETLFDGGLDAGHIVAHAKGGQTEPDNMVIEKMAPNRSKGTKETVVTQ